MAHSLSARKRVRQGNKLHERNSNARARMRTIIKTYRNHIAEGKLDEAKAFLPQVVHEIDVSAKKGVIKNETASRYKSRLTKLLNKQA